MTYGELGELIFDIRGVHKRVVVPSHQVRELILSLHKLKSFHNIKGKKTKNKYKKENERKEERERKIMNLKDTIIVRVEGLSIAY